MMEKFPYYNTEEQKLLEKLFFEKDQTTGEFLSAKEKVLEIIHKDLVNFYKWETTPEERIEIRRRLIVLAGFFVVIPIQELRDVSHKARLTQKKVVNESTVDPLGKDFTEINSYDLKYLEPFSTLYAHIIMEPDLTALDFIAGNRDKRHYPCSQYTVFRKRIQDEVRSANYLTASAEPLTQTQMISLYNPDGSPRDLITIGFDLVYESAFIDFFQHAPDITPVTLARNAHLVAKNFLHSAIRAYHTLDENKTPEENLFPVFLEAGVNRKMDRMDSLFMFIEEGLLPQVAQKIRSWNLQLGLPPEAGFVYWNEAGSQAKHE